MIKKCSYCGAINVFNKTGFCKNCDRRISDKISEKNLQTNPEKKTKITTSIIDSSLDAITLIERLRDMTETSRNTDKSGKSLVISVQRDGRFSIDSDNDKSVFVSGKIYDENGKAKILIEETYKPTTRMQNIIYVIHILAFTVIYLLTKPFSADFAKATMFNLIALAIVAYSLLNQLLTNNKNLKNANEDLKIMRGEIIRRVRAAEKWDD